MFKCIVNPNNKVTMLLSVFTLFINMSGCSRLHQEELKHLTGLQDSLKQNQENLSLDISIFSYRAKYIDSVLLVFQNHYTDTIGFEMGNNLSRYKSIRKVYKHNMGQFNSNLKEQKALEKQLSNLGQDLEAGKLSKQEFKNYYASEKLDVDKLVTSSRLVKKTVYEVEPDYIRITKYMQPFLATLKK
jgi:hypothetical protein